MPSVLFQYGLEKRRVVGTSVSSIILSEISTIHNARFFHEEEDVTPTDNISFNKLNIYSHLVVKIPPQDPLTIILSILATVAVTLLLTPKIPNAANRNIPEASPNNGLSGRTNEVRIGARKPAIYGTVNAVPDLLVLPYRVYNEAGREVEYNYMFVSEGTVSGTMFRDGSTQVKHIVGSSVELYHPNNSPLIGTPETVIGLPITEPFISPRKSSAINGQVLKPPNRVSVTDSIKLLSPNQLFFQNADDLTDKYDIGEALFLTHSVVGGTKWGHLGSIDGDDITSFDPSSEILVRW